MTDDYEKWERECKKMRASNKKLLAQFKEWLSDKALSQTSISRHVNNIEFYVNEYLLYDDAHKPEEGVSLVGTFLGYWFIKKAMWASESSIKGYAASLKKFYAFLHEMNKIDKEDLEYLKMIIKEDMPNWLETLRRYDDPNIEDMAEVWGR